MSMYLKEVGGEVECDVEGGSSADALRDTQGGERAPSGVAGMVVVVSGRAWEKASRREGGKGMSKGRRKKGRRMRKETRHLERRMTVQFGLRKELERRGEK